MIKSIKLALVATVFSIAFIGAHPEEQKTIILVNPEAAGLIEKKEHPLTAFYKSAHKNKVGLISELWKMTKYEVGANVASEEKAMFQDLSMLLSPEDPSTSALKKLAKLLLTGKQIGYPNHITGHFFVKLFEENERPDIAQIVKDVMRNKKLGKPEVITALIKKAHTANTVVGIASNISKDDLAHYKNPEIFGAAFANIFKEGCPEYVPDYTQDIKAPRMHQPEFWDKAIRDFQPPTDKKIILIDNDTKRVAIAQKAFSDAGFVFERSEAITN